MYETITRDSLQSFCPKPNIVSYRMLHSMTDEKHLSLQHGFAVWDAWWDVFKNPTIISIFPYAP
jgi:hypothetical protein